MTDPTIRFVALREEEADARRLLCQAFYDQLYRHAFPSVDEAEDSETWLPLLDANPPQGKPFLHIILALETLDAREITDQHVLGGIVFELYPVANCWLITYLAVLPSSQRRGIGKSLVRKAVDAILATCVGEKPAPPYIFAEAENPERMTDPNDVPNAYNRLLILEAFGFMRVNFNYTQPALAPTKRRLDNLLLLAKPLDEFATDLAGHRISSFLDEFYQALGQPDAHELQVMKSDLRDFGCVPLLPLSPEVPIRYDKTLGSARSVTVQFLFFTDLFAIAGRKKSIADKESLDLKALRRLLRDRDPKQFLTPFESFHKDIVVPFISEISMPLVVCCEPFNEKNRDDQPICPPRPIWIDLPRSVEIEWESQPIRRIVANPLDPVDCVSVAAQLTDYIALFETGIAAYGISIVIKPDEQAVPLNATELLLLEALVGTAGTTPDHLGFRLRNNPRPEMDKQDNLALDCFVGHVLMRERINRQSDASIVLLFRKTDGLMPAGLKDNLELLKDKLEHFTFGTPTMGIGEENNKPCRVSSYAPDFVAVEIVGADRHDDVLTYAQAATKRNIDVDHFSKRLAGIVQNVLDFDRQDSMEVQDSLLLNHRLGSEITFVHAKAMIWFCRYRRAYFDARSTIGADPYWLMTRLVLGHNEQLLIALRNELDLLEEQGQNKKAEITGVMERLRTMRRRMDRYVQNPFRYDSERSMYDFVSKVRGVEQQRQLLKADEQTLSARFQENATAEKERIDARINWTLMAIGVFQAAGVLLAVLSLQLGPLRYWIHGISKDDPVTDNPPLWLGVLGASMVLLFVGFSIALWTGYRAYSAFKKREKPLLPR
jgi:GNAT superfamily N-acetyltransferase